MKAGATLWPGRRGGRAAASRAASSRGAVVQRQGRPATTEAVRARYVVVADGAQLPLRAGARHRPRPLVPAWAWRSAATSRARSTTSPWIESHLDLRDRDGNHCPGYGWIFPVGDGTVNVGVGLLVDVPRLEGRQHLPSDGRVRAPPRPRAGASRPRPRAAPPTGGRLPTGGSVDAEGRPDLARRRRRGRLGQPVQRRGHLATRTRPAASPPTLLDEALRDRRRPRAAALPASGSTRSTASTSRWRALFVQADRQPGGDARAHPRRHAVAARSWSGCCGSWPTCCGPTSSAPPRPPTRPRPPSFACSSPIAKKIGSYQLLPFAARAGRAAASGPHVPLV